MGLIPDNNESAFFVREPAWHGVGVVLADYPGREEAMRLAGHDWDVVESSVFDEYSDGFNALPQYVAIKGWKQHKRSDNGTLLHVSKDSYSGIPNSIAYDFAEALLGEGFKFDCAISMDEGRQNALTLLLDEPIVITGDDSATLPYYACSWCHDGTGSLKGRSTSIRNVCQNTVSASEAEGSKLGTDFTIRHTKNWRDYVDEAKEAIKGTRESISVYQEAMESLALLPVTPEQRDLFVSTIIGDVGGVVSKSEAVSDRVKNNIEAERAKIGALFFGQTIPEAHALTGYGLHLAGVEYFDHLRAYRSKDSYVKRTLLTDNPAKASLTRTIRELVAA